MTAFPSTAARSLYDGDSSVDRLSRQTKRTRAPIEVAKPPYEPQSPSKTKRRRRESLHGRSSASPNVSRTMEDRALRSIELADNAVAQPTGNNDSAVYANVSDRLRWTPGSKSFVAVDQTETEHNLGDTHDDEAHTRDRIVLLPTRRARDLSRVPDHWRSRRSIQDRSDFVGLSGIVGRSPIDSPFHHSPRSSRTEASPSFARELSSPIKKYASPNKTHLSPFKQTFTPTMSSPLARQVDESASYLLDEDFPDFAGDDWETTRIAPPAFDRQYVEPIALLLSSPKEQDSPKSAIADSSTLQHIEPHLVDDTNDVAADEGPSLADQTAHIEQERDGDEHGDVAGLPVSPDLDGDIGSQVDDNSPSRSLITGEGGLELADDVLNVEEVQAADNDVATDVVQTANTPPQHTSLMNLQRRSVSHSPRAIKVDRGKSNEDDRASRSPSNSTSRRGGNSQASPPIANKIPSPSTPRSALRGGLSGHRGGLQPSPMREQEQHPMPDFHRSPGLSAETSRHAGETEVAPAPNPSTPHKPVVGYAQASSSRLRPPESIQLRATPSPRRKLHADVVEERIRQSPHRRQQSASSMLLTSPYRGSAAGTPSKAQTMSLRHLLDSHRQRDSSVPRSPSSSVAESLATPTKSLRAVAGRKSTPHPYRLQGRPADNAEAEKGNMPTPAASRMIPEAPDKSALEAGNITEIDFSTLLDEEESTSDDVEATELTFTRVNVPSKGKAHSTSQLNQSLSTRAIFDDLGVAFSDGAEEEAGSESALSDQPSMPAPMLGHRTSQYSRSGETGTAVQDTQDWHTSARYDDDEESMDSNDSGDDDDDAVVDEVSDSVASEHEESEEELEAEEQEVASEEEEEISAAGSVSLALKNRGIRHSEEDFGGSEGEETQSDSESNMSLGELDASDEDAESESHGLGSPGSTQGEAIVYGVEERDIEDDETDADEESLDEAGWMDELDRDIPKTVFESDAAPSSGDSRDSASVHASDVSFSGSELGEEANEESEEEVEHDALHIVAEGVHDYDYEDVYGSAMPVRDVDNNDDERLNFEREGSEDNISSHDDDLEQDLGDGDNDNEDLPLPELSPSETSVRTPSPDVNVERSRRLSVSSSPLHGSHRRRGSTTLAASNTVANISASMSTLLRRRTTILASRPNMVEVTSMNREAAARAAAILKKHHKYVQYGQLEANLEDDTWAETISADVLMSENDEDEEEEEDDEEDESVPATPNVPIGVRSGLAAARLSASRRVQPPSSVQTKTPKPPGSFPLTEQAIRSPRRPIQLNRPRTLDKLRAQHARGACCDRETFGESEWACLEIVLLAEIVAHANAMRSSRVISKSESLLLATEQLDIDALSKFFLEAHVKTQSSNAGDGLWSVSAIGRRAQILIKRFVRDLKHRYPHLLNEQTASTAPQHVDSSIDGQILPDESNADATQQPIPYRHVVASTPGRHTLPRVASSPASIGTMQNLYPELPRPVSRAESIPLDETQSAGDASNLSRLVRGFGKIASFLRIGEGEDRTAAEIVPSPKAVEGEEGEIIDVPMREAGLMSRPVSMAQSSYRTDRVDFAASAIASRAALVEQRTADASATSQQSSFGTGRRWQPPRPDATVSRLASSTGLLSSTSVVSPSSARRIATGSSSYVLPTALSMLSPATHAIARQKVDSFRDSRTERHWRTPHRARVTRQHGMHDASELPDATHGNQSRPTISRSYLR